VHVTQEQPPSGDIRERLEAFVAPAQQSVSRLEQLQRDIDALATVPPPSATTATVDDGGRLIALRIDPSARAELPDGALEHDLNLAIAAAHRDRPAAQAAPQAGSAIDLESLLEQLFNGDNATAAGTPPAPPERVWNDDRTVGVMCAEGVTQSVALAEGWARAQSEAAIEAEVLRTVDLASGKGNENG
jgi:hypothetical protein